MNKEQAWERAFVNTKLEYLDWQPDEEYVELVGKVINEEITGEQAIQILIKKYKVD